MAAPQQQTAVVTGGTAGVGRAVVRELAAQGWDIAVVARGQGGLDGACADIGEAGRRALGIQADVADAAQVGRAARQAEAELGPVGLWVNAAFAGYLQFFRDTTEEEFRRVTEVTYLGQVHGTRAALDLMRPRDRGVIINVGSAMAFRGIPLQAAYCGAKHAIKGFTESVMTELAHEKSKIRLCMVQLPGLNTTQFNWNLSKMPRHPMPVPPIFQPEVAARAIAFLARHPRRNMWVGIPTAYTILGERLAPGILDFYLGRTGVSSQQSGENLTQPRDASADRGAHGPFGARAHARDPLSWMSRHRMALTAGLAALTAMTAAGAVAGTRR
jgi:NAD(P)-dependent dehydrogenase (short-subunit alcohol dehydrogenase family)